MEFRSLMQDATETFDEYYVRLRRKAAHCEFADENREVRRLWVIPVFVVFHSIDSHPSVIYARCDQRRDYRYQLNPIQPVQ